MVGMMMSHGTLILEYFLDIWFSSVTVNFKQ